MTQTQKKYLLAEHTIDAVELNALADWLRTDPWLTQNELVRRFERAWADWVGTRFAVYVNSGSSANLLMYAALQYSQRLENRRIIVPAVSWATTVAPAIQLGWEPLMCEADRHHFGLDLAHLEALLEQHRPSTVILVHVLGVPNDMEAIAGLQKRFGFALMEDACAATGSLYDGRRVGTFGDLSSFSFFYGHHLSTIEGGMVCTNDPELHDLMLHLRSHGWDKDADKTHEAERADRAGMPVFNRPFTFYYPGFNLRGTDLQAFIGLSQLKKADDVVARRVENHRLYQARFLDHEHFRCAINERAVISSISFAALASSVEHRERVAEALRSNGIETRPLGGGNMSRQPFWAERYGITEMAMADRIHTTAFQLPNHPGLGSDDINFICDTALQVKP
jgi:CDP-6-deoxy-D-xylo-4-hexulose-3-dehydrase